MKYQRAVNRRLDDDAAPAADAEEPALVARCWPEVGDEPLPRVVQRGGHPVLDEGWVAVDDEARDSEAESTQP